MLYKEANTFKERIMCLIAKLTHGHVITPLGRIVLLSSDYKKVVKE